MTRQKRTLRANATFALRPSAQAAAIAVALLAGNQSVYAQAAAPSSLQRVEVTGSSIKRLEGETALQVETIKREDIDKAGVTTAAE